MAYYDGLTGLPNRALFEECLKQRLLMNERQKAKTAVMFIDVDDFKRVNDTLGHSYGDKLLKKIAERLNSNTRKSDSITRHRENDMYSRRGGDEFTVMLSVIKEFEDAAVVAGRIIHAMSDPFMLDGREILVTVSIGIAIYPDDGEDVDTILKNADAAMYDAKERGKNNYQYYRHSMNANTLERLNIEGDIKKALERGEFILHYQPQVDTFTRKVVGVEALIRWKHPEKGMVSPLDFIPVAEQTGLIIPISDWVVETACRQNRIWQEEGVADIPVSVNLTSHQFQQKNFIKNLIDLLEKTGLPPQSLHLEITESTLMKNTEMSFVNLYELSHLGLSMIIDDFGTGYSSLSYLKRFPIHAIKIDRSFVKDINTSADDAAIASAIISMAHTMNIKVVAEGVETEEQLTFLQERGCDEIQGYLFSRPLPADEITTYLVKEKKGEKGKTTIIK
jgi:diguanylate cyclase (GGDEF)-like protein